MRLLKLLLVVCLFGMASPAFASWSAVQTKYCTATGSPTSASCTFDAGTSAGNLVVVAITAYLGCTVGSVSDDKGNSYTLSSRQLNGGDPESQYQAWAQQTTGAATVVTLNSISGCTDTLMAIDEYHSSVAGTITQDVQGMATNAGSVSSMSVNITPSASGELVVAAMAQGGARTWTATGGYTRYGGTSTSGAISLYKLSATTNETPGATTDGAPTGLGIIATAFGLTPSPVSPLKAFFSMFWW